jgi:nucleotide-binding universal stress UspA family protein
MIAPGPWGDVVSAVREDAERRVHALPDVHPTVAEGSPIPALLELGTRSDLLVLGSRGYGPVRQLVQGTTSGYVQRHAECPVIVVPRPEATAEDADAAGSDRVETVG